MALDVVINLNVTMAVMYWKHWQAGNVALWVGYLPSVFDVK